jgi:hypothetical protein
MHCCGGKQRLQGGTLDPGFYNDIEKLSLKGEVISEKHLPCLSAF